MTLGRKGRRGEACKMESRQKQQYQKEVSISRKSEVQKSEVHGTVIFTQPGSFIASSLWQKSYRERYFYFISLAEVVQKLELKRGISLRNICWVRDCLSKREKIVFTRHLYTRVFTKTYQSSPPLENRGIVGSKTMNEIIWLMIISKSMLSNSVKRLTLWEFLTAPCRHRPEGTFC